MKDNEAVHVRIYMVEEGALRLVQHAEDYGRHVEWCRENKKRCMKMQIDMEKQCNDTEKAKTVKFQLDSGYKSSQEDKLILESLFEISKESYNPINPEKYFKLRTKQKNIEEKYYRDIYTINAIDEEEKDKYKWVLPVRYRDEKKSSESG